MDFIRVAEHNELVWVWVLEGLRSDETCGSSLPFAAFYMRNRLCVSRLRGSGKSATWAASETFRKNWKELRQDQAGTGATLQHWDALHGWEIQMINLPRVTISFNKLKAHHELNNRPPWLSRLKRPPSKRKIASSNLAGGFFFFRSSAKFTVVDIHFLSPAGPQLHATCSAACYCCCSSVTFSKLLEASMTSSNTRVWNGTFWFGFL